MKYLSYIDRINSNIEQARLEDVFAVFEELFGLEEIEMDEFLVERDAISKLKGDLVAINNDRANSLIDYDKYIQRRSTIILGIQNTKNALIRAFREEGDPELEEDTPQGIVSQNASQEINQAPQNQQASALSLIFNNYDKLIVGILFLACAVVFMISMITLFRGEEVGESEKFNLTVSGIGAVVCMLKYSLDDFFASRQLGNPSV